MSEPRRRSSRFIIGIGLGLVLGFAGMMGFHYIQNRLSQEWFKPGRAVSLAQMQKIAQAVESYTRSNNSRPNQLEELAQAKLISPADLVDVDRPEAPAISVATGRFDSRLDVLYFPALRPSDPGDLVVLCTLAARQQEDGLVVVYNDGRVTGGVTPAQMQRALQRTYSYLGGKMPRPKK